MSKPDQKLAVIVGGTGDIGIETGKLFIEHGAQVIITGRNQQRVAERVKLLGPAGHGERVDPGDEADLKRLFAKTGQFDYLVVTLGLQAQALPFAQTTDQDYQAALNAKFFYYIRSLRAALGHVKESVTWLTGSAGRAALPGLSNYGATCGALHGAQGGLAIELAPIRLNSVASGIVQTDFWTKLGLNEQQKSAMYADAATMIPAGVVPGPRPIAEALYFAATNIYTTGSIFDTSGGVVLGRMMPGERKAAFGGLASRV
jgi:NAD(P)-dependent dehydrogenase (short-subunit alcohol dehydrogenase family)